MCCWLLTSTTLRADSPVTARRGNMKTSSNGNVFRVTGSLCGEITVHRWIPLTKASDAELWFFFHLYLNKRLSKQSWGWWFETPSRSLWRHCNESTRCWCEPHIPAMIIYIYPRKVTRWWNLDITVYRQASNIRRNKSQNFNVSGLVLQVSLPSPLRPGVKSRMKM